MASVEANSPRKVLIVEDDALVRLTIAESFQAAGWAVMVAASGEEAIRFVGKAWQIEAVFTDLRLGGTLTGWDVAEAFRAADAGIPVVYTSGDPVLPMRQVDGSIFFQKPYDPAQIINACALLAEAGSERASRMLH